MQSEQVRFPSIVGTGLMLTSRVCTRTDRWGRETLASRHHMNYLHVEPQREILKVRQITYCNVRNSPKCIATSILIPQVNYISILKKYLLIVSQSTLQKTCRDVHLRVGVALKWFVSQTPYLIHETPETPHITGCGVLLIMHSLHNYNSGGD